MVTKLFNYYLIIYLHLDLLKLFSTMKKRFELRKVTVATRMTTLKPLSPNQLKKCTGHSNSIVVTEI
ncbi:hypothetical protein GCM10027085_58490 [Spirosoma aerophilum]